MNEANVPAPEAYYLPPTRYVPNSPLPLLVYRDVLPKPVTVESSQRFVEQHGWDRKGHVWEAFYKRHFHPNSHECYGVVSGSSVVLMGAGTSDETEGRDPHDSTSKAVGIRLTLRQGDLIIHPAGTSHANLSTEGEYRYLAFFPRDAPRWRTENGTKLMDVEAIMSEIKAVPMPQDPVTGDSGHLQRLWGEAAKKSC
ncbi:hypothetical protein BKA56DRAFT_613833 [Ilyonectria sp. MPI-CAGE-AT-0026]|nr:hypothetical protein BKA56DRAFT_613833 [Ilyonectria sp. MPI-CAGE-AT-0026]